MTLDPGPADQLRAAPATVAAIPVTTFGADGLIAEILAGWGLAAGDPR